MIVDPVTGNAGRTVRGRERHTTNQRMELRAAIEVLKALDCGRPVDLHTDSMYVVKGMREWVSGWKRRGWRKSDGSAVANEDLWRELDAAATDRKVNWIHVRGHAGIRFNEECDVIARAESEAAKADLA